jgi:hypothetical protein
MSTFNIGGVLRSYDMRTLQQQLAIAAAVAVEAWDAAPAATLALLEVRPLI